MRKHTVFVAGLLALLVIVGAASSREVFEGEWLIKADIQMGYVKK
jgi:hypothetical protein